MEKISVDEFLRLLQSISEEDYDDHNLNNDHQIEEYIESYDIKPKFKANDNGIIDLTNIKKEKIKEQIHKCTNLKIGNFYLRITRYYMFPMPDGLPLSMDIKLSEEKTKTPSGNPCKMNYPVLMDKDSRFSNRKWSSLFYNGIANNISIDLVVDIIRWLQVITKYPAFL